MLYGIAWALRNSDPLKKFETKASVLSYYDSKTPLTIQCDASAGSILDISKYRNTCEPSILILHGIAILRRIEYRMIRRYLGDISYDPEYRTIRYLRTDMAAEL